LEKLSIYFLVIFHFIFWWIFYRNPWKLCTSEIASNFFPHWLWMGRQLRNGILPIIDKIYYLYPGCIPFLSTFYPPYVISSYISSFLSKENSFRLYTWLILSHSLLGSFFSFIMLRQWFSSEVSLFGTLSLTYNSYMIRPQTPCFMFTSAWIPACLIKGFGWIAFGMAGLGGYWPIMLSGFPIFLFNIQCLTGALLVLPQFLPFLWYYPKSIRANKRLDPNWGKMPLKRYLFHLRWPENGMIHYPEYSFGIGLCLIFSCLRYTNWILLALYAFCGTQGLFILDRIPARFVYLVSFSLVMASLQTIALMNDILLALIVIQIFLLWKNRNIYPSFPFSQWWKKITELKYEGNKWPNNTGYMNEEHHQNYYGGFSLASNYHE
jgi:hypothetical protein